MMWSMDAMTQNRSYFCLLLLLAGLFTSCVKDVILDAMEDPQLAVYCVLSQDSTQTLKLSWTKGASRAEAPRVTEANAVLTDLTENLVVGSFERISESDWQLEYAAIPGHHYRLDVTVPGRDPIWAEQTMPAKFFWGFKAGLRIPKEDLPGLNFDIKRLTSYVSWVDGITFGEVRAEGLFYRCAFSSAVWLYADTYDAESGQYIPVKNLCTDYPYVDNINLTGKIRPGAGVPEYVNSPNLGWGTYHDYYLTGYPMHRDFLRFPKREDWAQYNGDDFDRVSYFAIDGDFKDPSTTLSFESRVTIDALSDDYDRFLCEAYMHYYSELSSDMSTIYLRDNVFTNIHGGLGIFGCVTHHYDALFVDEPRYFPWMRPKVRIDIFGPTYDPDNEPWGKEYVDL